MRKTNIKMFRDYDYYHPTVRAEYDAKHNWWILVRGPDTFYDEENKLMTWNTKEAAQEWVKKNYPKYKIIDKAVERCINYDEEEDC